MREKRMHEMSDEELAAVDEGLPEGQPHPTDYPDMVVDETEQIGDYVPDPLEEPES